ncbi:MAG: hypothetical protein LUF00_01385 [Lachnospiraceae bacterium]|nr:hypothetical protein [Lachnospiraceae bacterium]
MGNGVNTNIEALHEIKDSLVRFQERIAPLQSELTQAFQEIDEQLSQSVKFKMRQLEERQRRGTDEGRTDTFACDTCPGRIRLLIRSDTTHCREQGCNGTLHRVHTDRTYSSEQRRKDMDELEQLRQMVNNYNQQKNEFQHLFASFFSSEAGNAYRGIASLASCISILEQYLGTTISFDAGLEQDEAKEKTLNASATNSLDRATNGAVEVPLMSDLSDSFIAKLPHSRSAAVHTAYAKAPDYIVSAINQHCDKLRCIKDTEYETDCYGHYVLNRYGMRVKESCHYSPMEHHIAMHNDMTDAEYADVLQHELGHFIDDVLGRPSTGDRFRQAFSDAAARYNTDTPHGRMMLNNMLDDAFSTGAAFDRNITDIISALTHNDPVVVRRFTEEGIAYYRHQNDYWDRQLRDGTNAGMREKDSFANIFAIETGSYRISTNFAERWFPQLSKALRDSIGGA